MNELSDDDKVNIEEYYATDIEEKKIVMREYLRLSLVDAKEFILLVLVSMRKFFVRKF